MERRSANRNQPRKRYTVDAFEGIEELQDARSDGEDGHPQDDMLDDEDSVEEFNVAAESSSDGDAMSGVEADPEGEQDSDPAQSGGEPDDEEVVPASNVVRRPKKTSKFSPADFIPTKPRPLPKHTDTAGVPTYNRGLTDSVFKSASKDLRRLLQFGPDERDFRAFYEARARWAFDPTLPTRASNERGFGGMCRSTTADHDAWTNELKRWKGWWIHGKGQDVLSARQVLEGTTATTAKEHGLGVHQGWMPFLIGAFTQQHLLELPVGGSISLQAAWDHENDPNNPSYSSQQSGKSGYMLNLGAKVQCLDWAPNQDRRSQLLAVAVSDSAKTVGDRFDARYAPAFTPHPPYKSNIQIWAFRSTEDGRIDSDNPPSLHTVLCTEWGGVRHLKWCPVIDEEPSLNGFCLLGAIFTDGAIRVLQVDLTTGSTETTFLHVKRAALEARPPNTVITCLTWISPTRLAAGCANGCIAVWDLTALSTEPVTNARTYIYSVVSTSYVLSISSCSPSCPDLILTSSMGGVLAMSDLSRSAQSLVSQASTVFSSRSRIGASLNAWHDSGLTALYVDDNSMLRGAPIRRLFTTGILARYKSGASCLATSPCHPFVLVGTVNGDVVSSNPVERIIDGKAGIWQQTWFSHEWRRQTEEEKLNVTPQTETAEHSPNTTGPRETSQIHIGEEGLSRITEGFEAERCVLFNGERTTGSAPNHKDGISFTTIYEEKSAITALAWNPNLHAGGWAAAGMGNGLLRVEDIALDSAG